MVLQAVLAALLALVALALYFRYSKIGRALEQVPGPKSLPLIGNSLDMSLDSEKLFLFLRGLFSKYGGSIARIHGLNMGLVCVYEPSDLEVILSSTRYNYKYYPYNFLEPWLGKGLLTNNGDRWQTRRKLLTPAFHFNILRKFSWSFTAHTAELTRLVEPEVHQAQTHVQPLVTRTTLRVMCDTSMGNTRTEDAETYFDALHAFGRCVIERTAKVWLYPDFIYNLTSTSKLQDKAVKDLHRFTKRVIKERRENKQTQNDDEETSEYGTKNRLAMLDLLLENEKEGAIDEEGIREEVDTFMFEGHDTTSASLCFMIMRIANEPEIQDRIYQELEQIFGDSDRPASSEDLSEIKYLERCIKESLRLYPGVPYISRYLTEDTVLNGYTIPANVTLGIHIFDIHRRADQFPEPERFDPDRFLPDRVAARHPYAYIPFSAGPRNCIGQKFAMLEMKTVMSGLLRRFRLEPVTRPQDIMFVADLVLRSRDPIYVRFRHRK